jgi:hypothetical protein
LRSGFGCRVASALFQHSKPGFDHRKSGLGCFLAGAGAGGKFRDRLQLVPADEFQAADCFVYSGADDGLGFLAETCQGRDGAASDASEVIKKAWAFGHAGWSFQNVLWLGWRGTEFKALA